MKGVLGCCSSFPCQPAGGAYEAAALPEPASPPSRVEAFEDGAEELVNPKEKESIGITMHLPMEQADRATGADNRLCNLVPILEARTAQEPDKDAQGWSEEDKKLGPGPRSSSPSNKGSVGISKIDLSRKIISEAPGVPEESDVDERRESLKAALAAFGVLLVLVGGSTLLSWQRSMYEEPECPEVQNWVECCRRCGDGTFILPQGGEMELLWDDSFRAVLYFVAILWCFLGVGMVCDEFMASIEEITSQERVCYVYSEGRRHAVRRLLWNPTVANLSLMALGSSAPEILLSIIELLTNGLYSGELGPATVVGSAAFNLFMIVAACIVAIKPGEVRRIETIQVFCVTALWSIVAYIWVWVVLSVVSPDKVDLWEAVVTLLMFPALIITAFAADNGCHKACQDGSSDDADEQQIGTEQQRIKAEHGKLVNEESIRTVLHLQCRLPSQRTMKTRGQVRRSFTRLITGGQNSKKAGLTIGFPHHNHAVLECQGSVRIPVVASMTPEVPVEISYCTHEGNAKEGVRYRRTEGVLSFRPGGELEQFIEVPILDNNSWDPSEEFHITLSSVSPSEMPSAQQSKTPPPTAGIDRTTVWIIDDDEPGTLDFADHELRVEVGTSEVEVWVARSDGTAGEITCQYATVEDTAREGEDFVASSGQLSFGDGEKEKRLKLDILPVTERKGTRRFRVLLSRPSAGVQFSFLSQGDEASAACQVVLLGNRSYGLYLERYVDVRLMVINLRLWSGKLSEAFYCCGSPEDQAEASVLDWVSHLVSLFWKVLFLAVPPPKLLRGWATFSVALFMIGAVTALINDMASLLGCVLDLPKYVTAITLVALGTSMPDTFASRTAAMQSDTADDAIGNVTGSNGVNVFLGLGLTWIIGTVYWKVKGPTEEWKLHRYRGQAYQDLFPGYMEAGGFLQPAGSLAFSVLVFACLAFVCLGLLWFRRRRYGGELGGPYWAQRRDCAILVTLWLAYLGITIPQSLAVESR